MTAPVVVVDYGIGNVLSVMRAFAHLGAAPRLSSDPAEVAQADRLVLPGVGAFRDGMAGLEAARLTEAVHRFAGRGRPFLGICLGMQMMLDSSEEFGSHAGLGLIPGRIVAVPPRGADGSPHKVPHIGWNRLRRGPSGWDGTILQDLPADPAVYFVHSFMAEPDDPGHRLADCDYGGQRVGAVVRRDHLHGCQFHPEKSGPVGLKILENFLRT
jgi:glutamine amidotransferase